MTQVKNVYPDDRVTLREVGLRDGLQLVKTFPATAAKQRWLGEEYGAGVRHFEVGSFLPAATFPQFADVRDIVRTVAAPPGGARLAAVRRRSRYRPDSGGASGRARHSAGAQRARRQRGAGLGRCRSRHG